ncbi:MAG: molybdate ABC transporter substrate-binding protein [Elusimicrobia bacterium HGW-Elusimicrobia-1]|jgi:molybdate transport system substrate-binding protein|nr:MAG: molybdate ABC transporter substrate-binding protein [Elusimicrobia bacterium HGW-Elusimicrobia-1]
MKIIRTGLKTFALSASMFFMTTVSSTADMTAAAEKTKELFFFCGSAVKVPMDEIISAYEKSSGVKINVIYGGSGTLLSQMELSRRGDVYLCGSPDYIEIGERKKLLVPDTDKKIAYLVPAIIVPKGNPKNIRTLDDLARKGVRVGIGNPETVCLGLYSVELLQYNKLLEKVLPNVVVYAKSCEDTATLAVLGKVDAIIGWDVFESWNPTEVEWVKLDGKRIPRLAYAPVALTVFARDRAASSHFIDYLFSGDAAEIWRKWGYISDEAEARKHAPAAAIGGEYKIPENYYKTLKKIRGIR